MDQGAAEDTSGLASLTKHRSGVWPLVSGAEMQALDRLTIDGHGISGQLLMENAGRSLMRPVLELHASSLRREGMIRIFCGAGNNGGDGFVLARTLFSEGIRAETILIGDAASLPHDAALNWARLDEIGASRHVVDPLDDGFDWASLLSHTSVAVDALFGIGLTREIRGGFARLVESLCEERRAGLRILSVDIPSGIDASTGGVLGIAVRADRTLTISLPKLGLALEPGRSHAGEIEVTRIGIDDPDPERLPRTELWNVRAAARVFPERRRDGHKGVFGRVLAIAGSKGLMGAGALCARASLRAGSGLVTLAHPVGVTDENASLLDEVMTVEAAVTEAGGFARAAEKDLVEWAATRDVVALGPGLGRGPETGDLVVRLLRTLDQPIVLDADGLYPMGDDLTVLRDRAAMGSTAKTILTPHPGEAARLLGVEAIDINADRLASARGLAERSQSVVILKGAGTVVAEPEGRALIIPTGGPALASGGTGDVLTGIVAALLGSGCPAFQAAALAAWWHGSSADRLDQGRAGFGVLASEIADGLPDCATEMIRQLDSNDASFYGSIHGKADPDADLVLRFPGS
ncbi:MAG TPA: NAD(P)H-hydrate dehydratase [Myxococcales bacterium]|nr:NAD(P)H-hydrate dehydratase [Myxococcales bacterium]HIL80242.1 NAD(P)H-hydrate dehydratase [Myxococcales bacterium]